MKVLVFRAYYLSLFVRSSQGYSRNIPEIFQTPLLHLWKTLLEKILLSSGAISHGLAFIFIVSSFFSIDSISSLWFLVGIQIRFVWNSFTEWDIVILLILFAADWKLNSNE